MKRPITGGKPTDVWAFAVGGKRDLKHVFTFTDEAEARRVFESVRNSPYWGTVKWWGKYSASPESRKR